MRFLNKIIFINSAHVPYAEIKVDGNVHFIGTQGVGKSTILRAILFFYNADKLKLGIPKEKQNFDAFYFPYANSYIVYEVMRENGAYSILASKSMGRTFFRFIDAPYSAEWFMNENHEVFTEWGRIRDRIVPNQISSQVTSYEMYRDIIFGNNRKQEMVPFRKFAIVESPKFQNIPRTIQNVFLNSKLDANFIKETIIRSMNDEDTYIDLDYFRGQIKEFEQEYNDISRWFTKNKHGEIIVRKQAETVMNRYRELLYIKKQIKEEREKLNFSEKIAKEKLPLFEKEVQEVQEKQNRIKRLISEENNKYQKEREKLIGEKGGIDDKLKTIKQRLQFYAQTHIEEISKRIIQEDKLQQEHKHLERMVHDLTHQYNDILSKYRNLSEGLEGDWKAFKNRQDSLFLEKKKIVHERNETLLIQLREAEMSIGKSFEEKIATLQSNRMQLHQTLSANKQKAMRIDYSHPYVKEVEECQNSLSELDEKERELNLQIKQFQMNGEALRQEYAREREILEWGIEQKVKVVHQKRTEIDTQIKALDNLIEKHKGSLCEWLDKHKPQWQETIGRVVDETLILYHQGLNPHLKEIDNNCIFGVQMDLSTVERTLRTPDMIIQERTVLEQEAEQLKLQGGRLSDESSLAMANLDKKYNLRLKKISDEQHLLEAERQQIPSKIKKLKTELATWQRKEELAIQQEKARVEEIIEEVYARIRRTEEELNGLQKNKEKALKEAQKKYEEDKKETQKTLNIFVKELEENTKKKKKDYEVQKGEINHLQAEELKGQGADTKVIDGYTRQMETIQKEMEFIRQHRSLVSDYEKDKRELFDHEGDLKIYKKKIEQQLNDLNEKYLLREEGLMRQQCAIEGELSDVNRELTAIRSDLEKTVAFRKDETFCPPESLTEEQRATKKGCSSHIEELKSLIINTWKQTEFFEKAVHLFKSNFTAKNTFNFPMILNTTADYDHFAANLCEFVDQDKISDFQQRISERYTDIIRRISKETGDLTQNENEITKTIQAINKDFEERNFAGVIKLISLRSQPSNDKLMQLLIEIKRFNEENQFNMGEIDLFSQESRIEANQKAVEFLLIFMRYLLEDPGRKQLVLSDTFKLEFRVKENDNDTNWVEKIANVGSDGTDILVKAMVNIMLINVFKERASRKFGEFKIHCMMDEIGKLHPNNVKGILDFANCRNIFLINSSPTSYNVENYRYTYLLTKDKESYTQVISLLTHKHV